MSAPASGASAVMLEPFNHPQSVDLFNGWQRRYAHNLTATAEDLALFQRTLQDHYGVKAEFAAAHDGPFPNVVQGDGESLDAYYARVLAIFRGRGGSDKPENKPPLTLLEVSSVGEWVHRQEATEKENSLLFSEAAARSFINLPVSSLDGVALILTFTKDARNRF
ncbi:hypothetical protein E4U56_001530 [Claviceps arundinis]|uniref:Uncharacterized protein n=1 Tax=Claviceps arundinis TaxID=1623583 RepID=A0A9P7MQD7_9HYPO|nr:hypothetical protein E4U56_001530 [Claviceps arundinis]